MLLLGTSSFSSADWIGSFYPEGTELRDFLPYYATRFQTVEIDSTYYAIPSKSIVQGWRDRTPNGFLFAAKFPRSIVHCGKDARPDAQNILTSFAAKEETIKFLEVISILGNKLGPLLIQFPYFAKRDFPSVGPFLERLSQFLEVLPRRIRYGVEIRNHNWLSQRYVELLKKYNVAMVLVDHAYMPHADEIEKVVDPVTTDFSYVRLIGDRKEIEKITRTWDKEVIDRRERLERWALFIERLANRGVDVFAYVNNHYAGHAPATVERLRAYVARKTEIRQP